MTQLALIACMAKNRIIGRDGTIPWHEPEDMAHFRKLTAGQVVVMGPKTFASLHMSEGLPKRQNIIVSSKYPPNLNAGFSVFTTNSVASVVETYISERNCAKNPRRYFIIGGQKLYQSFMQFATHIYLTVLDYEVHGDTYFPPIPSNTFRMTEEVKGDSPQLKFQIWETKHLRPDPLKTEKLSKIRTAWWAKKKAAKEGG